MEKTFRDILRDFLEEEETLSPSETVTFSSSEPISPSYFDLNWKPSPSSPSEARAHSEYKVKVKPITTRPEKKTPPPPPEIVISLEKLPPSLRQAAQELITLGGADLQGGLSEIRLKRVHRQLVKRFHPDRQSAEASSARFQKVQECYSALAKFLTKEEPARAA
jgi:hypothetical protein